MTVTVLLVDDEELVRTGLRMILGTEPGIDVVGEAADGQQALAAVVELEPDVVLLDLRMPVLDGIEATRRLLAHHARARVLILTTFDADRYVYDAMKAGASGFLLKDVRPEQLAEAVRTVAAGESLLAPAITRRLVEQFIRRPRPEGVPSELADLTERELEVFREMARGLTNAEIAEALFVSPRTVDNHVTNLLAKLGVRSSRAAVAEARRRGIV